MSRYEFLARFQENSRERSIANLAAEVGALNLGITPPAVGFFVRSNYGPIKSKVELVGYALPTGKEIFVRSDLLPSELVVVVLHETRHAWQWLTNRWNGLESALERDARVFGYETWDLGNNASYEAVMAKLQEIKIAAVGALYLKRRTEQQKKYIRPGSKHPWPADIEFS